MTYYKLEMNFGERFVQIKRFGTQAECMGYLKRECLQGHFNLVKVRAYVYKNDKVLNQKQITI